MEKKAKSKSVGKAAPAGKAVSKQPLLVDSPWAPEVVVWASSW
jgi:hypothetical protein